MPKIYDALVIGTGVAGGVAVRILNENGLKVAVTDQGLFGGTCPLRGCEPKKVLVDMAETVVRFRGQEGNGLSGDIRMNWPDLARFKNSFTDSVPARVEESYKKAGIGIHHGKARFTGPGALDVGGEEVKADKIVIAAGAEPRELGIPGEEFVARSDDFLEIKALPERIAFIGGGYVSFEFAFAALTGGAKPLILHRSGQPLKTFDPDLSGMLVRELGARGLEVITEAPVTAVEWNGKGYMVHAGGNRYEADLVVHGAGRAPAIKGLGLENAGVETDGGGIKVNEYMQSVSNPAVYAAGDVTEGNGPPLTPVAVMEAETAARNILNGNTRKADYTGIPSALFTCPPLASVGLTEAGAEKLGIKYAKYYGQGGDWSEFKRLGEKAAGYKILYEPDSGNILGAHILGHNSAEVINIFGMAIRLGRTIEDLKNMSWAYPSYVYTIRYMLE